jgi:Ser/Thr protein kinase RdoA (MazF antagonist)
LSATADFELLVPDQIMDAVEEASGRRLSGLILPLPSYINRVYEVQDEEGGRLIVKFYRPGRWSLAALQDEHDFVGECAADEIPVIAPLVLPGGETLAEIEGIFFALFPKRQGRPLEINDDEEWKRVGRLVGRVHAVGRRADAPDRTRLHPSVFMQEHLRQLRDGGFITPRLRDEFAGVAGHILDLIVPLFDEVEFHRIHGDCHGGNLLNRPDDGLVLIDFDDMMMGPAVQDLWLLLPDRADRCARELGLLLQGYEQFLEFDDRTLRLIEPLRALRIIYYLAWCSRQLEDYTFRSTHPDWGSENFWRREIVDLQNQYQAIEQALGGGGRQR